MTAWEANQYWIPAALAFPAPDVPFHLKGLSRSQQLARLLRFDYPAPQHWSKIELTPELKSQLVALVGPHRRAIMKAMEIRNGTKAEETQVQV